LEGFYVKVRVHQGSVACLSVSATVVDEITTNAKADLLKEILYADDLDLMSSTIKKLREKFHKWKAAFESNRVKVKLGKAKVMVSRSGEMTIFKIDPCGICGNGVMATQSCHCA